MIAITTNSSIKVKPRDRTFLMDSLSELIGTGKNRTDKELKRIRGLLIFPVEGRSVSLSRHATHKTEILADNSYILKLIAIIVKRIHCTKRGSKPFPHSTLVPLSVSQQSPHARAVHIYGFCDVCRAIARRWEGPMLWHNAALMFPGFWLRTNS